MRLGYDAEPVLFVAQHARNPPRQRGERCIAQCAGGQSPRDSRGRGGGVDLACRSEARRAPGCSSPASTRSLGSADLYHASSVGILRDDRNSHRSRPSVHGRRPRRRPAGHGRQRIHGRVLWPNADPLGQCVGVGADTSPCTTVISIAEDMVRMTCNRARAFTLLRTSGSVRPGGWERPLSQVRGDPKQREAVRKALQSVMPGDTFVTVMPLIRWWMRSPLLATGRDHVRHLRRRWPAGCCDRSLRC